MISRKTAPFWAVFFVNYYSRDKIAKLSPRAEKKADKTATSSDENWFDIEIAKVLARATNSQFEKSEIHIKIPLIII